MGVGEKGQIMGGTGIGEMGVGEKGETSRVYTFFFLRINLIT